MSYQIPPEAYRERHYYNLRFLHLYLVMFDLHITFKESISGHLEIEKFEIRTWIRNRDGHYTGWISPLRMLWFYLVRIPQHPFLWKSEISRDIKRYDLLEIMIEDFRKELSYRRKFDSARLIAYWWMRFEILFHDLRWKMNVSKLRRS